MKKGIIIAVIVIAIIVIGVLLYKKYGKKEIVQDAPVPTGLTTAEMEEKFNLINEILEAGEKVPDFFEDTAESLEENTIAELKEILKEINTMVGVFS